MKKLFKRLNKYICVSTLFLFFGLACGTGCAGLIHHPDPLAGWQVCFSQNPYNLDKAIEADYQDYIAKLPVKQREHASIGFFYQDGSGQHAVRIYVFLNNVRWEHILIYDRENKRIRTIKYAAGRMMS